MLTVHITFYNKNGLPQIKVIRKNKINLITAYSLRRYHRTKISIGDNQPNG